MHLAHRLRSFLLVAAVLLAAARGAGAAEDKKGEAKRLYDEATAAFGVGNYAEAAEKYEASFKLHPDAALLYNAAQAYRMAGNRARALQIYRNFLRIYADNPRAEDARNHVAALERALADGDPGGAPAPAGADPGAGGPAPAVTTAPASPPVASMNARPQAAQPPALIEQQAPPPPVGEARPSLVSRPWFWVAVGAAVLGGTVAILLATRQDTYPRPTLGTLD
jgi:tetratricopeptide (TPR) repeat protein